MPRARTGGRVLALLMPGQRVTVVRTDGRRLSDEVLAGAGLFIILAIAVSRSDFRGLD